MNIQNVQIVQDLSRTVEERLNSRKANITTQSNVSVPQVNVPDAQDKMVDNPKILREEDLTKVVYPPFFPIGNTQDIDSIKGVKELTGENVKSASFVTVEKQKAILQKEINNKSTNVDAGAVRHDNTKSTDALMKATAPSVKDEANPRVVLDLKV